MRPVSDAFLAAVRGSHRMVAVARVVAPGQSGTDPAGTEITIADGDVAFDSTAQIRATLDLTTDGHGWDPRAGQHALQPYGNEIWVARGIQLGGHNELVSQGYYRITSVTQDSVPHGQLRIAGQDRMSAIIDDRFTSPRQFQHNQNISTTITQLAQETLPGTVVDFLADDAALGRDQQIDSDRYGFMKDLCDAIGAHMYWDYRGHLVVAPVPDLTSPVWTVDAGDGGVLVEASRTLSRDSVYNAIVASGEGADDTSPATSIAIDNDPSSPTYWYGDYGHVPGFYSSPTITTKGQAGIAARAALLKVLGLPYSIDFGAVSNPALEDYDPIRLRYPGKSEVHLLEKLTIPLTAAQAMDGTTRSSLPTTIEVS